MTFLTAGYVFTMFTVNFISGSKFVLIETDENENDRPNVGAAEIPSVTCNKTECEYKGECHPKYYQIDVGNFFLPAINRKNCGAEKCLPLTSMCRGKCGVTENSRPTLEPECEVATSLGGQCLKIDEEDPITHEYKRKNCDGKCIALETPCEGKCSDEFPWQCSEGGKCLRKKY